MKRQTQGIHSRSPRPLRRCAFVLSLMLVALAGCPKPGTRLPPQPLALADNERLVTIVGTNDIHGGFESARANNGQELGGLALLSGVVHSVREGLKAQYGKHADVLVLDGGDQFQGTLLSNYNEGTLAFDLMSKVGGVGFDAAVVGNHGYDFGPIGWLKDQVTPEADGSPSKEDPRGALKRARKHADFPLVSANTYLKSTIVDRSGRAIEVSGNNCAPVSKKIKASDIDWSRAKSPDFIKPYTIVKKAGLKVAVVGIDNESTPSTTTPANVSDLCFADGAETYLRMRERLEGKADLFVVVMHDGNSSNEFGATGFVKKLLAAERASAERGQPRRIIDAVVAGHTHFINEVMVWSSPENKADAVPMIQSGSGGEMYGRIDLVVDAKTKRVKRERTRLFAGNSLWPDRCPKKTLAYCEGETEVAKPGAAPREVYLEGVKLVADPEIAATIESGRKVLAPIADRVVGEADGPIAGNRTNESALADNFTDAMRTLSSADIAFINSSGLRAPIAAGVVTYEDLFRVLPFANRTVLMGPMKVGTVIKLLERSIKTCGEYGALMQSGLRVEFSRDCASAGGATDAKARLIRVETLAGEVLLDVPQGLLATPERSFMVATLDFLSAGGSGYTDFAEVPVVRDLGILREQLADAFLIQPAQFRSKIDGRWLERKP